MPKIKEVPADATSLPSWALPPGTERTEPEPLPVIEEDGIYFGLNADQQYHPAHALGSGDIKRLFRNPSSFWWGSWMNPMRPASVETKFKEFGTAVHIRVLEGEEKFLRLYQPAYEGDDLLKTVDHIREWIKDRGAVPMKGVKADLIRQALSMDPNVKIEDAIKAQAEEENKIILPADDYRRILISSAMIAGNPGLENAFSNGMPEVAIVHTEIVDGEPVRCKALLDYLKIRGIGDLKSTSNPKELDFQELCLIRFSEWKAHTQAAHYMRARELIPRFLAEGRVFGDHDPAWLKRVADQEEFGFSFVFFSTTGAPETFSISLSPGNELIERGHMRRSVALKNFVEYRRQFGEEMWVKREPPRELDISELPGWFDRA